MELELDELLLEEDELDDDEEVEVPVPVSSSLQPNPEAAAITSATRTTRLARLFRFIVQPPEGGACLAVTLVHVARRVKLRYRTTLDSGRELVDGASPSHSEIGSCG